MTGQSFRRIAIVNRGEAAMRLIHAARELGQQTGRELRTIALYTEPDARTLFVREADEAYALGPALVPGPGGRRVSAYLDHARVLDAVARARADAVWVGWGFVAEDADFAEACLARGLVFVGPSPAVMRRLGNKIAAKALAEGLGVPVTAWSGGPVTDDEARAHGERLGFPLLVKAAQAGGGRGIRKVASLDELPEALRGARAEAAKAFGDDSVYLERLVTGARHVEVQIVGDRAGEVWALGVRDCTIQRRNQKVIEEAPSPALGPALEERVRELSVRLARAAGYHNAGTVEWLFEPASESFYFMEVNTRLQVEHPVTELTTGVDLVKLQLEIAQGGRLAGAPPATRGHAIEVRLCAEDPDAGFVPSPGDIEVFQVPTGGGVRIDTGVGANDRIAPEFDSMIAKIIAHGATREEAIARLRRALSETSVLLRGGATNKAFLYELLGEPDFLACRTHTGWLDRRTATAEPVRRPHADIALLFAAIEVHQAEQALARSAFVAGAQRQPAACGETGTRTELRYGRERYELHVRRLADDRYRVDVEDARVELAVLRHGNAETWVRCRGERYRIVSVVHGSRHLVEVNGIPHRIDRDRGDVVRSPAPAIILSVRVRAGDEVAAGDPLVVLEAMKMEMPVRAPARGRVAAVHVAPNVQVPAGSPLVELEALETAEASTPEARLVFTAPADEPPPPSPRDLCRDALIALRAFLMGYEIDRSEIQRLVGAAAPHLGGIDRDPELVELEEGVLALYTDLTAFYRRPTAPGQTQAASPAELLATALRAHLGRGRELPSQALRPLERVLEHFGLRALERSARLEEILLNAHVGWSRLREDIGPVLTLLGRPRTGVDPVASPRAAARLRVQLERVLEASYELGAVSDLARRVRHRYIERPVFERARAEAYRDLEQRLATIARDPASARESGALRALVECPHSLLSFLGPSFAAAGPDFAAVLLEIFIRRYYSDRAIAGLTVEVHDGRPYVRAHLAADGKTMHIVATSAPHEALARAVRGAEAVLAELPGEDDVVFDCITTLDDYTLPEAHAHEVASSLEPCAFSRPLRRLCVAALYPRASRVVGYYTFNCVDGRSVPAEPYYDIHPVMADRLELTRLGDFTTTRLPAGEDIYLFHATAKDNPRDERLFAFLNIRDLTAVRDEAGRVVALPHLEQMFTEAVAAIRDYRAQHPEKHLFSNRILFYLRPPAELRLREVRRIIWRIAQATKGVGLEKVVARVRLRDTRSDGISERLLHLSLDDGNVVRLRVSTPATTPVRTLSRYKQKVAEARRRGMTYPYEIIRMLTPRELQPPLLIPPGTFVEHDLDAAGGLVPVEREYGGNHANVVVGVITSFVKRYERDGVRRVFISSDPTREMGALAEPECRRIIAALELAAEQGVPVDWFPISAGAKIAMNSGTENLDWTARVLRRIVELTQRGLEINVVVDGVNVGAQSYWNAEATMLMHTRGILVMTAEGSMVLTGKQALEYSGGVSADDHQGIGGVERIMGPNGQAQYAARDLTEACQILLRHHELTYVAPGERFPRRAQSRDPRDRDVTQASYRDPTGSFERVGDIFSAEKNPGKKRPFDVRQVMHAVVDHDQAPLERWGMMRDAEMAVVWDAFLGGMPVSLLGVESQRLVRQGLAPADGPAEWTGGTLFPLASKKVAHAINAASGRRPLVVLANLSGFDGSPESMRKLQLELGAEIGRAVVNFDGPMIFCVISRYHGGAYVVFSRTLNDDLEVAAVEGTFASVIGGAPAAAVVFARDVRSLTSADPRVADLRRRVEQASEEERAHVQAQLDELMRNVYNEKLGEVAARFDAVHTIERAREVGSVQHIISPSELRSYLVAAVERGIARFAKGSIARVS